MKRNSKGIIAVSASMLIAFSAMSVSAFAAETDGISVQVTISDGKGNIPVACETVSVTDADGDEKLTINDVLIIAHDDFYEGGSAAGYKSSEGQYGLGLDKLWGIENGGWFGYYLNDNMAMGLTDAVADGDYLNAFVYSDSHSDSFSWFDKHDEEGNAGDEFTLNLKRSYYGADWSPVTEAVEGASITINGKDTGVKTDADGNATVTLEAGTNIINAVSDTVVLVPAVCRVEAAGEAPGTTTTQAPETTTTTEATTQAETTATTANTTASTTAATTTSKAATTTGTSSPKTGDSGVGAAIAILGAAAAAGFVVRRRDEKA